MLSRSASVADSTEESACTIGLLASDSSGRQDHIGSKGEQTVPDFDRILVAYEDRQTQVVDDLVAELDASGEERARLRLVSQLVQSIIHTFGTFEADRASSRDDGDVGARRLPLSASAPGDRRPGEILHVTLRDLVDTGCPTVWQARRITLNLGLKRNMFISGEPGTGKSSLLNSLVAQLPANQHLVVIDEEEDVLPVIGERADVSRMVAAAGSQARTDAFRRAADMKPDWIVVGELAAEDIPSFLDALQGGPGGLATIATTEPDAPFNRALVANRKVAQRLTRVKPLVLHLQRERDGMPRLLDMLEVSVKAGTVALTSQAGLT